MSCSDVERLIAEKLERRLTKSERLYINAHIKNCEKCSEYNNEVELMICGNVNRSIVKELEKDERFNENVMLKIREAVATTTYITTKLTFGIVPMLLSLTKYFSYKL